MKTLQSWYTVIDGHKTQIVACIAVVVWACMFFGVITKEQYEMLLGLLGACGALSLRDAIKKVEKRAKK